MKRGLGTISVFVSVLISFIICMSGEAFATSLTPLATLKVSNNTPARGSQVTVDFVMPPTASQSGTVYLFMGDRPNKDNDLQNPVLIDSGNMVNGKITFGPYDVSDNVDDIGKFYYGQAYSGTTLSSIQPVVILPDTTRDRDIFADDTGYTILSTNTRKNTSSPITDAYKAVTKNATRQQFIVVQDSQAMPSFNLDYKGGCHGSKPVWIIAEHVVNPAEGVTPNVVLKKGEITVQTNNCNTRIVGIKSIGDKYNRSAVIYTTAGGTDGVHFYNFEIDGRYDHVAQAGDSLKWGFQTYELKNAVFMNNYIHDIREEHSFYIHNPLGVAGLSHLGQGLSFEITNSVIEEVGRTIVQVTSRSGDAHGTIGSGFAVIRNLVATDCCLGDYWGGGSAFTFAGRAKDLDVVMDNVVYRAGFNAGMPKSGTGVFVAHAQKDSGADGYGNGNIRIENSDFEIANGHGDRAMFTIEWGYLEDSVMSFKLKNTRIDPGSKDTFSISMRDLKGRIKPNARLTDENIGCAEKPCYLGKNKHLTWKSYYDAIKK